MRKRSLKLLLASLPLVLFSLFAGWQHQRTSYSNGWFFEDSEDSTLLTLGGTAALVAIMTVVAGVLTAIFDFVILRRGGNKSDSGAL
jgi:hypothetical protein